MNVTELTDEQLAQLAAREGSDGPAFVAILDRYRQRVWSVCYLRYRSIWPGWVSHVAADVAGLAIGWRVLFG